MNRELRIISCFSLPTDLAVEMGGWLEFAVGREYSVDLRSSDSGETVGVRFVKDGEEHYVSVKGSGGGPLFDKVLESECWLFLSERDLCSLDES